jgi:hypothetical protein
VSGQLFSHWTTAMNVFDLFSKREKRRRGDVPDVYSYDSIPKALRVQIVHIWRDTIGNAEQYKDQYGPDGPRSVYEAIVETLCREYGVFALARNPEYGYRNCLEELVSFFLTEGDMERVIDAIELSFRAIDGVTRGFNFLSRPNADELATEAISELNLRFREHGVGYQFVNGDIVRVDSEFIHHEAVKPALRLLSAKIYRGAQEEFLRAHEHYRQGNTKEALNEALKSFESTLKAVCKKRGWSIPDNAASKALLDICFTNGLIPQFWQSSMGGLRTLLESGVPTSRHKLSGHGQGTRPTKVPGYIAAYVLHMTASAIVFLAASEEASRK